MSSLINYDGFPEDIKSVFKNLIAQYHLKFEIEREGAYRLRNKHCIIRFTYDRGSVLCDILDPHSKDKFGRSVFQIARYLFPNEKIVDNDLQSVTPRDQLTKEERVISKNMKSVLLGDFAWVRGYLTYEEEIDKLISYLFQNPSVVPGIQDKFSRGDLTWISDLKEYLGKI